jgi:ApaG protein
MDTAITKGIKISVEPTYLEKESSPVKHKFIFSYHITIENLSDHTIQVLSRHWNIHDSLSKTREVIGDGILGKQPIIEVGGFHSYTSWCPLQSELGLMFGTYQIKILELEEIIDVRIPEFTLCANYVLN